MWQRVSASLPRRNSRSHQDKRPTRSFSVPRYLAFTIRRPRSPPLQSSLRLAPPLSPSLPLPNLPQLYLLSLLSPTYLPLPYPLSEPSRYPLSEPSRTSLLSLILLTALSSSLTSLLPAPPLLPCVSPVGRPSPLSASIPPCLRASLGEEGRRGRGGGEGGTLSSLPYSLSHYLTPLSHCLWEERKQSRYQQ